MRAGGNAALETGAQREMALDKLRGHGINAHLYLPDKGCADPELAATLRFLARFGYIMTDAKGALVGKTVKARPSADDLASLPRSSTLWGV